MSNWNEPINSSSYLAVLDQLKELIHKTAGLMTNTTGDTNIPVNSIRYYNKRFEKYNGTTWGQLASLYDINVKQLDGKNSLYFTTFSSNIGNVNTGILAAGHFNDASHGNRGNGSLHDVANTTTEGFMSAADKIKLNAVKVFSDDGIRDAYHRSVPEASITESCYNTISSLPTGIRKYSPRRLYDIIMCRLTTGIRSVKFDRLYKPSTVHFDVDNGQYQSYTIKAGGETLDIELHPDKPYTMYLYLQCGPSNIATPPAGKWQGGAIVKMDKGTCLLTVNWDGSSYFYMVLQDMR